MSREKVAGDSDKQRVVKALKWAKQIKMVYTTTEGKRLFREAVKDIENRLRKGGDKKCL